MAIKFQEMEEKLQKDKEDKQKKAEEEKLKEAEKEEQNEIEEVPEIVAVTEISVKAEEKPVEISSVYDPNSPRFPSSDPKNNFQPSYSTDSHVPYQPDLSEESHQVADERITYTPGPIRVPTAEAFEADAEKENLITVSDLPPIPDTIVEQERLEMIEINNDGTSGHLSHSLP